MIQGVKGTLQRARVLHAQRQCHGTGAPQTVHVTGAGGDGEPGGMLGGQGFNHVDKLVGDSTRFAGIGGPGGCEDGHECDIETTLPGPRVVEFPLGDAADQIDVGVPVQSIWRIDVRVDDEMALRQRLGLLDGLVGVASKTGDGRRDGENPLHE